ncbi:hypothetical protein CPB85DRAFT_1350728 [Mucidula mucida]|nr:hypothetical protein CPB85DRAFT_1350728 [Mucidula mucida]
MEKESHTTLLSLARSVSLVSLLTGLLLMDSSLSDRLSSCILSTHHYLHFPPIVCTAYRVIHTQHGCNTTSFGHRGRTRYRLPDSRLEPIRPNLHLQS